MFRVSYTKIFEESGDKYEGCEFRTFEALADAWNYYMKIKDTDKMASVYDGYSKLY